MPEGRVFSIRDFNIQGTYQPALVKALGRLAANDVIRKVSKGKYYKPRQTMFGILSPSIMELVKDLLERNGKPIGYITGTAAFAEMGLTTQITSVITIGTRQYRRPLRRGEYTVSFILQPNDITEANISLLRILDAIKLIREIPAASPDDCVQILGTKIKALSEEDRKRLVELAENYTPYVRALLGAIFESLHADTYFLRETLNGTTKYKLPVSIRALPMKKKWNIL